MTEETRCEPPPEWRDRDGEHHIYYHPTDTEVRGNPIVVRWGARAQGWWADHLDLRGHSPAEAASMGWRYLAPVTPPAVVAALVEALEGLMDGHRWQDAHTFIDGTPIGAGWARKVMPEDDALTAARAALAAYREAGR